MTNTTRTRHTADMADRAIRVARPVVCSEVGSEAIPAAVRRVGTAKDIRRETTQPRAVHTVHDIPNPSRATRPIHVIEDGGTARATKSPHGSVTKKPSVVARWITGEEAERRRQMDYRREEGNYRGKGPKNYTRSDDRIKENVSERLEDHSYLDASDIDIEVNSGEVVLSGTVDSRYAKRLAEDLAESCSGVRNVENRIRVNSQWFNDRSSNYGSTTTSTSSTSDSNTLTNQSKTATGR